MAEKKKWVIVEEPWAQENVTHLTGPLVYHAMGTQKLKNLAALSLAHELETLVQAKVQETNVGI